MLPLTKRKKFKSSEVEEYMLGKWFKKWEDIQPAEKARWRIKIVTNAQNKKDFDLFSGFRLEKGLKIITALGLEDNDAVSLFEKKIRLGKLISVSMIIRKREDN